MLLALMMPLIAVAGAPTAYVAVQDGTPSSTRGDLTALNPQHGQVETLPSAEPANDALAAERQAKATNALSDYKSYIQNFPAGRSVEAFKSVVASREGAIAELIAHPVKGPLRAGYTASPEQLFLAIDLKELRKVAPTGGAVRAGWIIAEDGQIENCHILKTSGSEQLDRITCDLVAKYLKAYPARDAKGLPFRATDIRTFNWPS